jgi:hypothetical protein
VSAASGEENEGTSRRARTGGGRDGADSSPCDSDGTMRERGISAHTYAKREGEERERS